MYRKLEYGGFLNEINKTFILNEQIGKNLENFEHPVKKGVKAKKLYPLVPL